MGARHHVYRDRQGQMQRQLHGQVQRHAHEAAEPLLRRLSLLLSLTLALGACGHDLAPDSTSNVYPTNYKSDILAAMHAYLNDPTGIRDAAISEPTLKSSGIVSPYIVCLRFNPKKDASEYAGPREIAAVFLAGRLDRFIDAPKEDCAGVTYGAFPELQKLPP
jgi:hypothetical protein